VSDKPFFDRPVPAAVSITVIVAIIGWVGTTFFLPLAEEHPIGAATALLVVLMGILAAFRVKAWLGRPREFSSDWFKVSWRKFRGDVQVTSELLCASCVKPFDVSTRSEGRNGVTKKTVTFTCPRCGASKVIEGERSLNNLLRRAKFEIEKSLRRGK